MLGQCRAGLQGPLGAGSSRRGVGESLREVWHMEKVTMPRTCERAGRSRSAEEGGDIVQRPREGLDLQEAWAGRARGPHPDPRGLGDSVMTGVCTHAPEVFWVAVGPFGLSPGE